MVVTYSPEVAGSGLTELGNAVRSLTAHGEGDGPDTSVLCQMKMLSSVSFWPHPPHWIEYHITYHTAQTCVGLTKYCQWIGCIYSPPVSLTIYVYRDPMACHLNSRL